MVERLVIGRQSSMEPTRTDAELALYGRYVVSKRLADAGFAFQFPELESALRDLYDLSN